MHMSRNQTIYITNVTGGTGRNHGKVSGVAYVFLFFNMIMGIYISELMGSGYKFIV